MYTGFIYRKLQSRLGGPDALLFYQEPSRYNFHFCYINCNKNYLINYVNRLFLGKRATMFANQQKFVIHKLSDPCDSKSNDPNVSSSNRIKSQINEFLLTRYPKNKNLDIIFNIMIKHDLINEDLFFVPMPALHVADFCSFVNNRFDKPETTKKDMIKFCKYLNSKSIKFPKITVKNPVAQKLLT